jgi:hypothetical protein
MNIEDHPIIPSKQGHIQVQLNFLGGSVESSTQEDFLPYISSSLYAGNCPVDKAPVIA